MTTAFGPLVLVQIRIWRMEGSDQPSALRHPGPWLFVAFKNLCFLGIKMSVAAAVYLIRHFTFWIFIAPIKLIYDLSRVIKKSGQKNRDILKHVLTNYDWIFILLMAQRKQCDLILATLDNVLSLWKFAFWLIYYLTKY